MTWLRPSETRRLAILLLLSWLPLATAAADFAELCADRAAIERVYYKHRLGTKPPFEQTLPRETLEQLVRMDLRKESVLRQRYGVAITPGVLAAEVQRINTTSRAPKMLTEIKAALGNDPEKFAQAFAKPLLVERLLREKFDHDDTLHARQRRACEQARLELLTAKTNGATAAKLLAMLRERHEDRVSEAAWQLAARPALSNTSSPSELEIRKRFGPGAQLLSSPQAEEDRKAYFEDLPAELQRVLRAQLRSAGDISAVIETPAGFLLYVATGKSESVLSVASVHLSKRGFEQWLEEQPETTTP